MAAKRAPLDRRCVNDFVTELQRHYESGTGSDQIKTDRQIETLIRIFARMLETVTQRLNQAAEKNLVAFLDMIGISRLPPRPARVPLVFALDQKSGIPVVIPAGTQASATALPDQEEQVFETETDLTVIGPQLVRVFSVDPVRGRWSDQSIICSPNPAAEEVTLFSGSKPLQYRLFLGDSRMFGRAGAKFTVSLSWQSSNWKSNPDIKWYWVDEDGQTYREFNVKGSFPGDKPKRQDISFKVGQIPVSSPQGYDGDQKERSWENRWIVAVLTRIEAELELKTVKLSLTDSGTGIRPKRAFFNDQPLDLGKDFFPFGERPKFNDAFYLASALFAKKNTKFTINLKTKAINPSKDLVNVQLKWEQWDGEKWSELNPVDNCRSFTSDGKVTFKTPNNIQPAVVNGVTDFWVRVRLVAGDYGQEATYQTTANGWEFQQATFNPPVIKSWLMDYESPAVANQNPEQILTEDIFDWRDVTKSCTEGKGFRIRQPIKTTPIDPPQLYLAFDRDLRMLPVTLFFPLVGNEFGHAPNAVWEYWNGSGWDILPVDDGTRNFTQPGIVKFQTPEDLASRPFFNLVHYWLRVRLENARQRTLPRVRGVYFNAVWARQQQTVSAEIAGSGNGQPRQIYQLRHYPILAGESVRIREENFSGAGQWAIETRPVTNEDWGDHQEQSTSGVCWREVGAFALSGPDSRHYLLDRGQGTLTFGDGQRGMIPPAGKDNIQCDYSYGGGVRGNVKAGTITELRTAIPEIAGVSNPVAAEGGAELEELERAIIRGPHFIRHRDRTVTQEDFEWLAREASPVIRQVKCLATMRLNPSLGTDAPAEYRWEPGAVTVVVVPESEEPRPKLSPELAAQIRTYLSERTYLGLGGSNPALTVIGPDYVRVDVTITAHLNPAVEAWKAKELIVRTLQQFLHPLRGGPESRGWEMGRSVYSTEIYGLIQGVTGVDHVENLILTASRQCYTLRLAEDWRVDGDFPRDSPVETGDGRICGLLAEELATGSVLDRIPVKGFQEKQVVYLLYQGNKHRLMIQTVAADKLECLVAEAEQSPTGFPADCRLETADQWLRTYLVEPARRDGNRIELHPAGFKVDDPIVLRRRGEQRSGSTSLPRIGIVTTDTIFLAPQELPYSGCQRVNRFSGEFCNGSSISREYRW